jgi:T-lymphoma invasion and metastasis-inducing protein 1
MDDAFFLKSTGDFICLTKAGLKKDDEIIVINGAIVSDLDMMYIEGVLQEEVSLCLMLRSARSAPPEPGLLRSTDDIMSLVCPPPPSDNFLPEDIICNMIVPAPSSKHSFNMLTDDALGV